MTRIIAQDLQLDGGLIWTPAVHRQILTFSQTGDVDRRPSDSAATSIFELFYVGSGRGGVEYLRYTLETAASNKPDRMAVVSDGQRMTSHQGAPGSVARVAGLGSCVGVHIPEKAAM